MATKRTSKTAPERFENAPRSTGGPGVRCVTSSGREYRILPGPGRQQHTLWQTTPDGYLELATAASPNELYSLIEWKS